jgi:collagenase-like PrtC family protease
MKLSIGPLLYLWDRKAVFEFYERLCQAPVDIVYLGEVVCAKRRQLALSDWLEIGDQLAAVGKQVVLSTLALSEAESELGAMRRIAENGRFAVEANDMGAVNMLSGSVPFVVGPHINVYNAETLKFLAEAGAQRFVLPVELGAEVLKSLQQQKPVGMETEVFGFGRLPLAFSARCFTARAHNVSKDSCEFLCGDYPAGLLLHTREHKPFLVLNGIQVQSARTHNLIGQTDALRALNVDVVRLSPQPEGMGDIIATFRDVLDGRLQSQEAAHALMRDTADGACDGYWHQRPGMDWGAGA